VQEIATHPAEQWTIDGARRTPEEIPCSLAEMREGGVRMLQLIYFSGGIGKNRLSATSFIGYSMRRFVGIGTYEDEGDDPVVREGVRDDIHAHEVGERGKVGIVPKSRHHSGDTDAGHDDTKTRG
jgi:hypothetical protein